MQKAPTADFFLHIPSSWVKIWWHIENQFPGTPEAGEKQCTDKRESTQNINPVTKYVRRQILRTLTKGFPSM